MSDNWERVRAELDIWAKQDRTAQFWWRDDDAWDVSDRLRAMLTVARAFDIVVGVSVIPVRLSRRLIATLTPESAARVLVHGFAHANHSRANQARREFGGARPLEDAVADLASALAITRDAFGERVLPVLVPPWNRIAPRIVPLLPRLGYRGLSTWKPRLKARPVPGLLQVNTHLDFIDWRRGRAVKDERLIAAALLRKLRWRRQRRARAREPLGLLTHHDYWTPEKERIVVRVLEITREHKAVRWLSPQAAFEL